MDIISAFVSTLTWYWYLLLLIFTCFIILIGIPVYVNILFHSASLGWHNGWQSAFKKYLEQEKKKGGEVKDG